MRADRWHQRFARLAFGCASPGHQRFARLAFGCASHGHQRFARLAFGCASHLLARVSAVAERQVRRRAAAFLLLFLAPLLAVSACGARRVVVPVVTDPSALSIPPGARGLTTPQTALDGIAAVLVKELGLPLPGAVTAYLYDSSSSFEHGLVNDARVAPVRAAELSVFAFGIARRGQVLLNTEAAGVNVEWLRLIAHELTHVAQFELAGGEGRGEQWLAEGMADWVAFTALQRLGVDDLARRRVTAFGGVRRQAALARSRLDLETLGSPRAFTIRHQQEGSLPTYQLAFLMADYLIRRDGFARLVQYFRLLAGTDRVVAFEQSFGQSIERFEAEILAHLRTHAPADATSSPSALPR